MSQLITARKEKIHLAYIWVDVEINYVSEVAFYLFLYFLSKEKNFRSYQMLRFFIKK